MVHIHLHLRISPEDPFAQIRVQTHGRAGIALSGPAHVHFKGSVLLRIHMIHIPQQIFRQGLKAIVLADHHRTDLRNAEYPLQRIHRVLIVKFAFRLHIDPSLFLGHLEFAVHIFQGVLDLADQRVFKKISVFSLDSNFRIFDQKCFKHPLPPTFWHTAAAWAALPAAP